jgi:hypothetical protein
MSKDEAWKECQSALRFICDDRCSKVDCGCEEFISQIREAIYV